MRCYLYFFIEFVSYKIETPCEIKVKLTKILTVTNRQNIEKLN